MRLLFSLMLLLVCSSCWITKDSDATASQSSCSTQICQNGKFNVSYPFGNDDGCGESSAFLTQPSCGSPSDDPLRWIGFNNSLDLSTAPIVRGISSSPDDNNLRYINLTWNRNLAAGDTSDNAEVCNPLSFNYMPDYFPIWTSGIRLEHLDSDVFDYSNRSLVMLLNCTNGDAVTELKNGTLSCKNYCQGCNKSWEHDLSDPEKCFEVPKLDLDLNQTSKLNCTHFQMLVMNSNTYNHSDTLAKVGMIQLSWNDDQIQGSETCKECMKSNGTCGYSPSNAFQCFCPKNETTSNDCNHTTKGTSFLSMFLFHRIVFCLNHMRNYSAYIFLIPLNFSNFSQLAAQPYAKR